MKEEKGIKGLIVRYYSLLWEEDVSFHEVLRRLYIDYDMSMNKIAKELNIGVGTVFNFLKEEGIQKEQFKWK